MAVCLLVIQDVSSLWCITFSPWRCMWMTIPNWPYMAFSNTMRSSRTMRRIVNFLNSLMFWSSIRFVHDLREFNLNLISLCWVPENVNSFKRQKILYLRVCKTCCVEKLLLWKWPMLAISKYKKNCRLLNERKISWWWIILNKIFIRWWKFIMT